MKIPQFNARLHPDTITKIKQLQVVIGKKNRPPAALSQAEVVSLAVDALHGTEIISQNKRKTT